MAKGTLGAERFKHYMIQDYLYLTDYIDVLNKTKELAESDELISFIGAKYLKGILTVL